MNKPFRRKSIRLKDYDYSASGFYFVTICTRDKRPIIGKYREEVERILVAFPQRFSGLSIDYYCLMPSHVHLILIFDDAGVSLGKVVRTFKALVSKKTGQKALWQRNYYEHVIRTDEALRNIREYINNNPLVERIEFQDFYETGLMNQAPTEIESGRA